jgi:nicotinamidase-related amidase
MWDGDGTGSNNEERGGASSAVLIVDMMSDFNFEDGDKVFEAARSIAPNIARLKDRAQRAGMPVLFVNDSNGSDPANSILFAKSISERSKHGRAVIDVLKPDPRNSFIFKPQRSGFYATSLGSILMKHNVTNVYVTGVTTDICVLFTAHDAYMRGFNVRVPEDCTGAVEAKHHVEALRFLKRVADVDIRPAGNVMFDEAEFASVSRSEAARHGLDG